MSFKEFRLLRGFGRTVGQLGTRISSTALPARHQRSCKPGAVGSNDMR